MAVRDAVCTAVAVAAVAVLAACGASEPPDDQPTPSMTATTAPTTPATGNGSPIHSPTDTATDPTVAPAAGEPIRLPSLTGAFPQGWRIIERTEGANSAGDTDPTTGGVIFVSDLEYFGTGDFEEIVGNVLKHYEDSRRKPERAEDRAVDGVVGWVIEGRHDDAEFVYEWGTVYNGMAVHFTFEYFEAPDDPMAMVDSVLASVQWK